MYFFFNCSSHILPSEYDCLKSLQDDAPIVGYDQVDEIIRQEFRGMSVDQVFKPGSFEKNPIASGWIWSESIYLISIQRIE